MAQFSIAFNELKDSASLILLRFRKKDIQKIFTAATRSVKKTITDRYSYTSGPVTVTCIIEAVCDFLKYVMIWSFCSEVINYSFQRCSGKGLINVSEARKYLLIGDISTSFIHTNSRKYSKSIYDKIEALENCISFVDSTVICSSTPGDHELQIVAYRDHKRKYALNYQAVSTPKGLIFTLMGLWRGVDMTVHKRYTEGVAYIHNKR